MKECSFLRCLFRILLLGVSCRFIYAGIYNLVDILKWRQEITAPCVIEGVNLVTIYELVLHIACVYVIIGIIILYKLIKKVFFTHPEQEN